MEQSLLWRSVGTLVLLTTITGLFTHNAAAMSFTPPPGNSAPPASTGGASRGTFVPPANNTAPRQTAGGASRNGFIPPSTNSTPRTAAGGATRTNLYGYLPLPSEGQTVSMLAVTPQNFYGTTLADRPTLLIYIPASNAQDAIFSLKDEAGNTVYQTLLSVPQTAGVVAVQLPEDAPALEIDKHYQWFFALMVDGDLSPSTPYVSAWIQRIVPDASLVQSLQQQSPHEQAETLAANGVWYDSAAILTGLRMAQPTNAVFTEDWHELLNSVGLQEVTTAYLTASR